MFNARPAFRKAALFAGRASLAPACRHPFYRLDLAIPHQQSTIEIVHRRANMPRKEMKRLPNVRTRRFVPQRHW